MSQAMYEDLCHNATAENKYSEIVKRRGEEF